ncbi:hypothetical protein WC3_00903 [Escherichia coli KTE35]|nr:hypothetical protein WC3_00903 [Escherichia coli KTE35]EOU99762.1 hypothetical protein WEY_00907 [Escherichia coli KTE34]
MKYSSIFSMLSFFILFACNETAVYGSDENIIFMRYVEKLHLDKYSVKNTVKTETMAIQLAEIYVRYRYGERGNDSNLLIVFYVQIMPDDFVMQLHRF